MNYYLIPHADNSVSFQIFERINIIFKRQKQRYTDDITFVKTALRTANRKTALFDLFFYYSPAGSQQFDVLQYIQSIDIQSLFTKLELFDAASETYLLDRIGQNDRSLTIQDLRFFLFPSIFSQNSQPDPKMFRKDLLTFLRCFLNDLTFNYNDLISRFVGIYKKRMHCEKQDNLSPFKMNLFLSILYQLKKLRGGDSLTTGESISNIFKEEYQSFFEAHSDIYRNNAFRQGLFLLGTLISKIKSQQKGKSSTFLKKLNFSGIPPRRVPALIAQVKEFSQIYKIYEEPGIWGNVMDRLQGIQTSGMKPDEILFYILSGISFDDYLGMKAWHEKQLNENTQGEKK
jgi:CRISPR-associated protein Csh1